MKKCLILSVSFALGCVAAVPAAQAGNCHGDKKKVVVAAPVEVDVKEEVVVKVEEPVVVAVSDPISLRSAFKDANREARATKKAAVLGHRAAKFSRKAADAASQEAKQEAVMQAYDAN
jgi:hypothetical protein